MDKAECASPDTVSDRKCLVVCFNANNDPWYLVTVAIIMDPKYSPACAVSLSQATAAALQKMRTDGTAPRRCSDGQIYGLSVCAFCASLPAAAWHHAPWGGGRVRNVVGVPRHKPKKKS